MLFGGDALVDAGGMREMKARLVSVALTRVLANEVLREGQPVDAGGSEYEPYTLVPTLVNKYRLNFLEFVVGRLD